MKVNIIPYIYLSVNRTFLRSWTDVFWDKQIIEGWHLPHTKVYIYSIYWPLCAVQKPQLYVYHRNLQFTRNVNGTLMVGQCVEGVFSTFYICFHTNMNRIFNWNYFCVTCTYCWYAVFTTDIIHMQQINTLHVQVNIFQVPHYMHDNNK